MFTVVTATKFWALGTSEDVTPQLAIERTQIDKCYH